MVELMRHKGPTVLAVTGIDFSQNEVFFFLHHKNKSCCKTLQLREV